MDRLSTEGKRRCVALDGGGPRVDPVGHESVAIGAVALRCFGEEAFPDVAIGTPQDGETVAGGDVLAHGVALVAMHSPFSLLEVDRIGWEVPVHNGVAIRVEVEALLSH